MEHSEECEKLPIQQEGKTGSRNSFKQLTCSGADSAAERRNQATTGVASLSPAAFRWSAFLTSHTPSNFTKYGSTEMPGKFVVSRAPARGRCQGSGVIVRSLDLADRVGKAPGIGDRVASEGVGF
jgi:hypothetical protein